MAVPHLWSDSFADVKRKRFTRDDVEDMTKAGLFLDQRFELLEGELIDKMGQNPPHAAAIRRILDCLGRIFGFLRVQGQLPVEAADTDQRSSLPEPDVAVFRELNPEFDSRHPRGDELLLAVEVADSSLRTDLYRKARLYARAGVPEYWVLDLAARKLYIHKNPGEEGYSLIQWFPEAGSVTIADAIVSVAELLPVVLVPAA